VEVPVTKEEAARAAAVAQKRMDTTSDYNLIDSNCATYASEVMAAAGVKTPGIPSPALNMAAVAMQSRGAIETSIMVQKAGAVSSAAKGAVNRA
jgi:hypothetical protein